MLNHVDSDRSRRLLRAVLLGSTVVLAGCVSGASKESIERQAAIEVDKCLEQVGLFETPGLNGRLISMDVEISPDGSIQTLDIVNRDDFADDPQLASTIDNLTQKAVAECAPVDLPSDRYDVWQSVVFEVKLD